MGESLEDVQDLSKDDEVVATEEVQQLTKLLEDNLSEEDLDDKDRDLLGIGVLLDNLKTAEDGPDVLNLPGHAFVDALAKINITRNANIAKLSKKRRHLTTNGGSWQFERSANYTCSSAQRTVGTTLQTRYCGLARFSWQTRKEEE